MEKGRRGLAGAEAGSSGEAVGPGEKQETGFTKPEVLGARKASQTEGQNCQATVNQGQSLATRPLARPVASPGH